MGFAVDSLAMEIQSDLIVLPASRFLPLPWAVRGPLGLRSGAEVSLALCRGSGRRRRLPDIVVTPLNTASLESSCSIEVVVRERAGAVAEFLAAFGEAVIRLSNNSVNIALSDTITLEGRDRHKINLVLEPARGMAIGLPEIEAVVREVSVSRLPREASIVGPIPLRDVKLGKLTAHRKYTVDGGWIKAQEWHDELRRAYPELSTEYDLGRLVASCNPDQRLLRFVVPRLGVIEIKVPHFDIPGALRGIVAAVHSSGYNVLSSRLSRAAPFPHSSSNSVFVAACEPLRRSVSSKALEKALRKVEPKFGVSPSITISEGRRASDTVYLKPRRREVVDLDPYMIGLRDQAKVDVDEQFFRTYETFPARRVFLSTRFINESAESKIIDEQSRTIRKITDVLGRLGCAVVDASIRASSAGKASDDYVYSAVYPKLWASDACLVLALSEDGSGKLSPSIGHEIGFFAGRARPWTVLVSRGRDVDPVFGNIVGKNRLVYANCPTGLNDGAQNSIAAVLGAWVKSSLIRSE